LGILPLGRVTFDSTKPPCFRMGFRRIERGEEKAPGPKVEKGAFLIWRPASFGFADPDHGIQLEEAFGIFGIALRKADVAE